MSLLFSRFWLAGSGSNEALHLVWRSSPLQYIIYTCSERLKKMPGDSFLEKRLQSFNAGDEHDIAIYRNEAMPTT